MSTKRSRVNVTPNSPTDEKYQTSSSGSSYFNGPIVEITNEKSEYKIEVPMYVFKNTGSIKWNAILKEYVDNHQTSLTKIDKINGRMEYIINECFKKDVVLFVINFLKSIDNSYDREFLRDNWHMIHRLGDYWDLKSVNELVDIYLLGSLMDYDFEENKKYPRIKIHSQFLIDSKISTVGYEIYKGLLLEDLSASCSSYNPICSNVFYPDTKIVRASSIDCWDTIKRIFNLRSTQFVTNKSLATRYLILQGFLYYINNHNDAPSGNVNLMLDFIKYLKWSNAQE